MNLGPGKRGKLAKVVQYTFLLVYSHTTLNAPDLFQYVFLFGILKMQGIGIDVATRGEDVTPQEELSKKGEGWWVVSKQYLSSDSSVSGAGISKR